jgi:hypothetical protein
LIENTGVGHGWVEGGALYPPHEEIYMQGLWVEALRGIAELADQVNDRKLAAEARTAAERTRAATESLYWLPRDGFYAFATNRPQSTPRTAEPGPNRDRRQARMDALSRMRLVDEDTVLPAVPLWWRVLDEARAQSQIDHIGSGAMATDWGTRIISGRSLLYDPLSYHYGSVWPLFTGWAAMGAYRYGRPHVGYQALMANVLLTYDGALGYVTELLSGDFNAPFGRSSHHQVWSEAMVVTPAVRGLLGVEVSGGGRGLSFAPQLPAHWDRVVMRNIAAGDARYDISLDRTPGRETVKIIRRTPESSGINRGPAAPAPTIVAPAFPLDARINRVLVNGRAARFQVARAGDVQRAEVTVELTAETTQVEYIYDEGTEVYIETQALVPGASSQGLRILRSRADASALRLSLEGRGGRTYQLRVRTSRRLGETGGVKKTEGGERDPQLLVSFEGPEETYVRRELTIPLLER